MMKIIERDSRLHTAPGAASVGPRMDGGPTNGITRNISMKQAHAHCIMKTAPPFGGHGAKIGEQVNHIG